MLAGLTPIAPTHEVVVTLLLDQRADASFLLVGIIGREVWLVVQARRRGRAAARLHVQIVGLFAVDRGGAGRSWSRWSPASRSTAASTGCSRRRTRAMIENSLIVADAYLQRARAD